LSELFLEAWDVRLGAVFDDLSIDYAKDGNSCCSYWLTRWSDAIILTLMGTASRPAVRDLVLLGDDTRVEQKPAQRAALSWAALVKQLTIR
jgi:hypothetical protein